MYLGALLGANLRSFSTWDLVVNKFNQRFTFWHRAYMSFRVRWYEVLFFNGGASLDGEYKFNVDGSTRGKLDPIGCGGVLHNLEVYVAGVFFEPFGIQDSNFSKLMAILNALRLFSCSLFVGSKLIVEFSSRMALSWESMIILFYRIILF
ncbi:Uncharacterized protein TCM_036479 [Theobroma cacao]|uniref:RNase H type-1 domain-containing protein n=1 Tax=Theobroma cacao TaxID=3641 RepID=A0A061FJR3_THECC|nr:Uncharacterized protein TCM_036479 [Theobroma cacao]